MSERLDAIRRIVAEVLEREPEEIVDDADFTEVYDVDSLRAVEILSRIDKTFDLDIPQSELTRMRNLLAVYEVVSGHAGWQD